MASASETLTLRDWLRSAPFTLALSAGFFGFFAHAGFLSVLEEEGLLPERITGTSAGALIAGAWAAGLDTELIRRSLFQVQRQDFWDPQPGWGLLAGARFRSLLTDLFPVHQFEACRVPVAVSAHDIWQRTTQVLQSGALVPAVYASCAVPWLFHPICIDNQWLWDGGVSDRPAIRSIPDPHRILLHHLPSRSRWRHWFHQPARIPNRPNLVAVTLSALPNVNPFQLEAGPFAFEVARQGMRQALEQVVHLRPDAVQMGGIHLTVPQTL